MAVKQWNKNSKGHENPLVGYYEQFSNVPKFLYIPGPINVLSITIGLQNDANGNMIPDTQSSFPFTESGSCDHFHKSLSVYGYPHFIHVYLPLNNNSYVDKFASAHVFYESPKTLN